MKARIFYLLIFGSLFLDLHSTFASNVKQCHSFQKILQADSDVVDNSQNSNSFFSATDVDDDVSSDLDVDDDDDDVSFSARKKISFERTACLNITHYTLHHFCNDLHNKFSSDADSYHLPPSHFISLRVFKI